MRYRLLIIISLLGLASRSATAGISDEERARVAEMMNVICRKAVDKIPRDEVPKRAHAWLAGGRIKTLAGGDPLFEKYKAVMNADLKVGSEEMVVKKDSPVIFLENEGYLGAVFFYKSKGVPNAWFYSAIEVRSLKTGEKVAWIFASCGGAGAEEANAPEGLLP